MNTRRVFTILAAGLLAVAVASPTLAAQKRGRSMAQHSKQSGAALQQGAGSQQRTRDRVRANSGASMLQQKSQKRLRDGSCTTAD